MGPLADQVALELGQRPEDVEDQLAAGGRGVDRLLERPGSPAPGLEVAQGLDQVRELATQAVELPDHQGIPGLQEPRTWSSPGRVGLAPLASSVKIRRQPAAEASYCKSRFCSRVETRA